MRRLNTLALLRCVVVMSSVGFCHSPAQPFQLVGAFPNLAFTKPVFLTHAGDGSGRLFIVQQNGIIKAFQNNPTVASAKTFLDLSGKISSSSGEEGLLGLAFHPQFAANGYFFVDYTAPNPLRTVIARYHVSATDSTVADTAGQVILEILQPFSNHNGGMLAFGPDGYLYIGTGDGGSGGDPLNNGQSLNTLLGKILRIDVGGSSANRQYLIPADNPFVANPNGFREEIWAYGLRNPWRFSFDKMTGKLWAGDVGQNAHEEVDVIERGRNYGWNVMEGFSCYSPSSGCDQTGLTLPLIDYPHSVGISITGGYVYHGSRRPELVGAYVYGDYGTRNIWALRMNGSTVLSDSLLVVAPNALSSFGEDASGELYIVTYSGSAQTQVYYINTSTAASVGPEEQQVDGFRLEDNYPNPFNPTTTVRYVVGRVVAPSGAFSGGVEGPNANHVRLAVYDILGREVAVLLDEYKEAGNYEVRWDATQFSSGVYVYKFTSGNFSSSRRMMLVR
jgi:glucose/arabinose dehydrogenase